MVLFSSIWEFIESKENWSQYVERFEQFVAAIEDHKKKAIFLLLDQLLIGPWETCVLQRNLQKSGETYWTHVNLLQPEASNNNATISFLQ